MSKLVTIVAISVVCGSAVGASAAAGPVATAGNRAVVTRSSAGSAASGLSFTLRGFPLVCGRPRGVLRVVLPPASLPSKVDPGAVRLDGRHPASVDVAGRTLILRPMLPTGLTCHSIVLGPLHVAVEPAAHLRLGRRRTVRVTVLYGLRAYDTIGTVIAR